MTLMSSREWADGVVKCMNACLYYFQYALELWWQLCFHFHSTALRVVLSVNQVIKLESGPRSSCVCLWVFSFRFMVCIWMRQLGQGSWVCFCECVYMHFSTSVKFRTYFVRTFCLWRELRALQLEIGRWTLAERLYYEACTACATVRISKSKTISYSYSLIIVLNV